MLLQQEGGTPAAWTEPALLGARPVQSSQPKGFQVTATVQQPRERKVVPKGTQRQEHSASSGKPGQPDFILTADAHGTTVLPGAEGEHSPVHHDALPNKLAGLGAPALRRSNAALKKHLSKGKQPDPNTEISKSFDSK